jgi:hypothetical protein
MPEAGRQQDTSSGAVKQVLAFAATLAVAAVIGIAIPALWFRIGAAIQGSTGARPAVFLAMVVIVAGIISTYIVLVQVAGRVAAWRLGSDLPHPRRFNWNRSMRDEHREGPARLNLLERAFATAAIVVGTGYIVWVLVFAPSSLPPPGGP